MTALEHALCESIYISETGFETGDSTSYKPPEPRQVLLCKFWILLFATPKPRFYTKNSSYRLKHVVEYFHGEYSERQYISNGAFISAAIHLGYGYRISGPNAFFNMCFSNWNEYYKKTIDGHCDKKRYGFLRWKL